MTNIAPVPHFEERPGTTAERINAEPHRNPRTGRRSGERQAEEQLGWTPAVSSAFVGGVSAAHGIFEARVGGQAQGRTDLGAMDPPPTWDAVDAAERGAFAGAADYGEPGQAYPPRYQPRNPNLGHLTPLDGLARGERQGTVYGKTYAPANGGRGRRNAADVTGL